jgi:ABC-type dipeptide/oligopeptide/nickel transport system permease subunit
VDAGQQDQRKGAWVLGLAGTGALLLGVACAGLWLVTSLEWLGMGTPSPLPTLGGAVRESVLVFRGFVGAVAVLWASSLSLYAAADALTGFFSSKEILARLNE